MNSPTHRRIRRIDFDAEALPLPWLEDGRDVKLEQALSDLDLDTGHIDNLLNAAQRFNGPVRVHEDDGSVYLDENFHLRRVLDKVPDYLAGARAVGLSEEQVNELMIHIFDSNPYEFAGDSNENILWTYGEIFKRKAEKEEPIQPGEYQTIKEFITISGEYGLLGSAASSLLYASRIGIPIEQATPLIAHLAEADGHLAGYTIGPFNEALKSLIPAEVNAETVVQVLSAIGGERPYFNQGLYRAFEHLVIFASQAEHRTPQQLLDLIKNHLDLKLEAQAAITAVAKQDSDKELTTGSSAVEIIDIAEEVAQYFIPKEGKLEVLGLPYQTKRSLEDGLEDLRKIAEAKLISNLEIGEGMWVFDSKSQTWYSLGGKLEYLEGRLRNNFIPYDISRLSTDPLLFHIHPGAYGSLISPMPGSGPQPELFDDDLTDFLMATPSRADYDTARHFVEHAIAQNQSRAFIVHKNGITEYTYPHEAYRLSAMARDARDLRDETILAYDWAEAVRINPSREQVLNELIADLSSRFPEGFTLRMLKTVELVSTS